MDKKTVVVITDCKDVAFNEMRRIIINECTKIGCHDVEVELVGVSEFSIVNAAFLARLMADYYPAGTVLSVVINPQKERSARIYGETSNGIKFFGANTGALNWLLEDFGHTALHEIHDPGFISFGGKYVHAPNVAKLVAGVPLHEFGRSFAAESLNVLDIPQGTVVHIDNFGLLKIKGDAPSFDEGTRLKVFVNGEYKLSAVFAQRMMSREDREWVIYPGSSLHSLPELGTVRYPDGYKEIGIKIGDVIRWEII